MVDQMAGQSSRRTAIAMLIAALALAPWMTIWMTMTIDAAAAADPQYPNWKGQWIPVIRSGVADTRLRDHQRIDLFGQALDVDLASRCCSAMRIWRSLSAHRFKRAVSRHCSGPLPVRYTPATSTVN